MIDSYLEYIQEGYVLSDKTISVDLYKFENGKSNKLLIVGLIASGKTTLGMYLSKKYKVGLDNTDNCELKSKSEPIEKFIKCNIDMVRSKKRSIVEGVGLIDLYTEFGYKKELQSYPMIIIGRSVLSSSFKAFQRNYKAWLRQTNINITMGQKRISSLRKHRIQQPRAVVKIFKRD